MPPKQAATTGKKESKRISKPQVQQLAVGLKRGHFVTKKQRPASKRATKISKRVELVRDVIREVSGFAPYERRVMELLRNDLEKRALKLAKKKLGGHQRAKKKWAELQDSLRKLREEKAKETQK
uniref:60S ribosomal protein L36 n=1 Tax=Hordeum vulgare subsp. vulgare TaxID=112509 RepID=F2DS27_HORVV|nr:predicted protein [Hordeum vulgare subsp. vulgare]